MLNWVHCNVLSGSPDQPGCCWSMHAPGGGGPKGSPGFQGSVVDQFSPVSDDLSPPYHIALLLWDSSSAMRSDKATVLTSN